MIMKQCAVEDLDCVGHRPVRLSFDAVQDRFRSLSSLS
jgi:hypothetical protein